MIYNTISLYDFSDKPKLIRRGIRLYRIAKNYTTL